MRWLVAAPGPAFSVQDVYEGWVEGLRAAGEQVHEFPLGELMVFYDSVHIEREGEYRKAIPTDEAKRLAVDRLAAALWKVRPHILMSVSSFFADRDMLDHARRAYGTKVILLHTESPYEEGRQIELAPYADLTILNDPTHVDAYEGTAVWFPHAYRPAIHHPGGTRDIDFSFVGTGYPSRVEFFEAMNLGGVDVRLGGNWMRLPEGHPFRGWLAHPPDHCMFNDEAADLYRRSRTSLNLYRREAEAEHLAAGYACGPREIELAACGTWFARDPRGESDRLFPMLPTFTDPAEAADLIKWALANPDAREEASRAAMAAVADRTFENHATKLLRLIDRRGVHNGA